MHECLDAVQEIKQEEIVAIDGLDESWGAGADLIPPASEQDSSMVSISTIIYFGRLIYKMDLRWLSLF